MDGLDRICDLLSGEPRTMDELAAATNLPLWRINEILTKLLLDGTTVTLKLKKKGRLRTHYTLKTKAQP